MKRHLPRQPEFGAREGAPGLARRSPRRAGLGAAAGGVRGAAARRPELLGAGGPAGESGSRTSSDPLGREAAGPGCRQRGRREAAARSEPGASPELTRHLASARVRPPVRPPGDPPADLFWAPGERSRG